MKLYEIQSDIDKIISQAINENGEIVDEQELSKLDQLMIEKEQKCLNIAYVYKNNSANIDAIKSEMSRLRAMQKSSQNKMDWAKKYLNANMSTDERYENVQAKIRWQKSTSVYVDPSMQDDLPEEFKKVTIEPRKNDIKAAIKDGADIPGCKLIENQGLVIQ